MSSGTTAAQPHAPDNPYPTATYADAKRSNRATQQEEDKMNLDEAIDYINRGRTATYSAADIDTIRRVTAELGVSEFEGRQDGRFFADVDGRVHVHPTMIVTNQPVAGSTRTDTYPPLPFQLELSRWTERGSLAAPTDTTVRMCQNCFNPLDAGHDDGCY